MKLIIENICKIAFADIELNGITIITGKNNTGKSTIGKTLWTMFEALSDLSGKALRERMGRCDRILSRNTMLLSRYYGDSAYENQIKKLIKGESSIDEVLAYLNRFEGESQNQAYTESDLAVIRKSLEELLSIDDETLYSQIVLDRFNVIFARQFEPLYRNHGVSKVKMIIRGKELSVTFEKSLPKLKVELDLINSPFLFDSPNQLDFARRPPWMLSRVSSDYMDSVQNGKIIESFIRQENTNNAALESIIIKRRFEEIDSMISKTIGGRVIYDVNKGFLFEESNLSGKLNLLNISQGVKAMALIQAAFSNGAIKEGDVLILDEPEIHLHPDWQIKYAEFIVLLQKSFNLTILITSHSPDFVQAIRLYSEIYEIGSRVNAYLSDLGEDGAVTMRKLPNGSWDEVFERFATSFDTLMNLQRDLEDSSNE